MAVLDVFAWTPLLLADSVNINIHVLSVEDIVTLTDTVQTNQIVLHVGHALLLSDEAKANFCLYPHVADTLTMHQDGRRTPINVVAADHLIMWQNAHTNPKWPDVKQTLVLIDQATCVLAKGTFDTLVLSQSVTVQKSVALHAASTLTMLSKATVFVPDQFWTSYDVVVVNP